MFDHFSTPRGLRCIFSRTYDYPEYGALDGKTIASMFSRTHTLVDYFAASFINERLPLSWGHASRRCPGSKQPSRRENTRIKRALYLFQIYCNIVFQHETDFHPDKEIKRFRRSYLYTFFSSPFSPWVNEQLACMHDYLEEVLSEAFDEVAAHDMEWGKISVDWLAQGKLNEHKQAYVSLHVTN